MEGVPFTIQSNLVYALRASLKDHDWPQRYSDIADWSRGLRRELCTMDLPILAPDSCAAPAVITIALPELHSSEAVGDALKERGILVSYRSHYLLERNWIQACMMGPERRPADTFIRLLKKELGCA